MTEELALSLAKVSGSVVLLAGVLLAVSRVARRLQLQPEIARKLIHVGLGLYCVTFPWVFEHTWEVAATCGLAILVFALARGRMRTSLGEGLHGVSRVSYGEVLFAVSVLLLFELKEGHFTLADSGLQTAPVPVLYILPLLILTLCDAASAVVGVNYGRTRFQVEGGVKTWEGVTIFVLTAWLVSLIALLLFSEADRVDAVVIAFIVAGFGALLEGASWRGLDNLFIPLGLYFILANLMPKGLEALMAASAAFLGLVALALLLSRRLQFDRHLIASGATLFFCIAIFSGLASLLAPLAVVVASTVVARLRPVDAPREGLNLLLSVLTLGLAWFLLSDLAGLNTIYAYNITFAALAVAVIARFSPATRPLLLLAACGLAWAVAAVRILVIDRPDEESLFFAALAFALIVGAAVATTLTRPWPGRPWAKISLVSMGAGLTALPWSPG